MSDIERFNAIYTALKGRSDIDATEAMGFDPEKSQFKLATAESVNIRHQGKKQQARVIGLTVNNAINAANDGGSDETLTQLIATRDGTVIRLYRHVESFLFGDDLMETKIPDSNRALADESAFVAIEQASSAYIERTVREDNTLSTEDKPSSPGHITPPPEIFIRAATKEQAFPQNSLRSQKPLTHRHITPPPEKTKDDTQTPETVPPQTSLRSQLLKDAASLWSGMPIAPRNDISREKLEGLSPEQIDTIERQVSTERAMAFIEIAKDLNAKKTSLYVETRGYSNRETTTSIQEMEDLSVVGSRTLFIRRLFVGHGWVIEGSISGGSILLENGRSYICRRPSPEKDGEVHSRYLGISNYDNRKSTTTYSVQPIDPDSAVMQDAMRAPWASDYGYKKLVEKLVRLGMR